MYQFVAAVRRRSDDFERPVIIAMIVVHMVEPSIHQIIDMVAMRHRFVAAIGAMLMLLAMTVGAVGAAIGIARAHLDHMLVDMALMRVMEVPVMQIIDMPFMLHCGVAAIGSVGMRMMIMYMVLARHDGFSC